jgi:hypothetical protein
MPCVYNADAMRKWRNRRSDRLLTQNIAASALKDKRTGFRLKAWLPVRAVQVQVLSPALSGQGFTSNCRPLPISYRRPLFPPTWLFRGTLVGSGACLRARTMRITRRVEIMACLIPAACGGCSESDLRKLERARRDTATARNAFRTSSTGYSRVQQRTPACRTSVRRIRAFG